MTKEEWLAITNRAITSVTDCFSPQAIRHARNVIETAAEDFQKFGGGETIAQTLSNEPTLPLFPEIDHH